MKLYDKLCLDKPIHFFVIKSLLFDEGRIMKIWTTLFINLNYSLELNIKLYIIYF